jgi:hypothetical protein
MRKLKTKETQKIYTERVERIMNNISTVLEKPMQLLSQNNPNKEVIDS